MRLVFLGPPGAGKGTQAKAVAGAFGMAHVSTGDMFREMSKERSKLAKELKSYMDKGLLVPDSVVLKVVDKVLGSRKCSKGFLLDGFPRTLPQAEGLSEILGSSRKPLDAVYYFSLPDQVVIERLSGRRTCKRCGQNFHVRYMPPKLAAVCDKCGGPLIQREDDKEQTVRKRLEVYHEQTADLIEYYKSRELLVEIDAGRTPEEIESELTQMLSKLGTDGKGS